MQAPGVTRGTEGGWRRAAPLLLLPVMLGGCFTVEGNEAITDRFLARTSAEAITSMQEERRQHLSGFQLPEPSDPGADLPAPPEAQELDLPGALRIALTRSRRFLREREDVDLQALSLRDAQHIFEPQLASTVAFLMTDGRSISRVTSQDANFSVRQRLPWGGDLSLTSGHDTTQVNPETGVTLRGSTNRLGASISQPLLRGAGPAVTMEPLTQAQRNMVYAVRNFELFRQDFAIEIIRDFYGLVESEQRIETAEANYERSQELYDRTAARNRIGQVPELDVLQAEQQLLSAENNVIDARESYQSSLDNFKVLLGLPLETELTLLSSRPEFVPVDVSAEDAIQIALAERLDYRNSTDQLEDVTRHHRLARNALLPDLDVSAGVDVITDQETDLLTTDFKDRGWSMGVTMTLPLDRVAERNAYRSSRIRLERAQRAHELLGDTISNGVRATLRNLRRAADSLRIQERILEQQERAYRLATRQYELGQVQNRDVVDAANDLGDARNGVVSNIVDYEIARRQLQRDLGILVVEDLLVELEGASQMTEDAGE